jgi:hypothetical protein
MMVATFAGMVFVVAATSKESPPPPGDPDQDPNFRVTEARKKANRTIMGMLDDIEQMLNKDPDVRMERCGDDAGCFDLRVTFPTDKSGLGSDALERRLRAVADVISEKLRSGHPDERKDVEIILEGHTDKRLPRIAATDRDRQMHNWRLSARRALAGLDIFREQGLKPPEFHVVAVGYADSQPLCREETDACYDRNRRMTLRLRANVWEIERREVGRGARARHGGDG